MNMTNNSLFLMKIDDLSQMMTIPQAKGR